MATSRRLPWRRISAFAVDWCVAAVYLGIWTVIVLTAGLGDMERPETAAERLQGQLFAFAILSGPVVLYFALMEAGPWRATIGKRLLGLEVIGPGDARVSVIRSLCRSALKFLPWEAAHAAIWHSNVRPFIDPPPPLNLTIMLAAQAVWLWFAVSLLVGTGRTPYDRIVRVRVVR